MGSAVKVRRIQKIEVDSPDLPSKLAEALKASGKSVMKVCGEVDISRTYWYRLIKGDEESIAEETLRKIEQVLGADFGVDFEEK